MYRIVLAAVHLAVLALLAMPAVAQDKAAIQKLNDKWDEAFNRGDAAAVAAMYTQDAYLLPEGAEMIKGREGIQAFWADAAKEIGDARLTTLDVLPMGPDYLREIGTFHFKTKGDKPQELNGKYVVVWRKIGNDWLLATDIWNGDQ
jgi:uncharacterized protein (TIGR02246 family)